MDLRPYIESTNLNATVLGKEIDSLVDDALNHDLFGVCVPPFWVKRAWREIAGRELNLISVVGFPFGFQMTETKSLETQLCLRDGADEIDLVFHHTSFANNYPWTKIELTKISKMVHDEGKLLKVIIEVSLWSKPELERICKLCVDAGVDFIKTSSGVNTPPCTAKEVDFIRRQIPVHVGLKASGGIKSKELAISLINAGADRIGTSSALKLI